MKPTSPRPPSSLFIRFAGAFLIAATTHVAVAQNAPTTRPAAPAAPAPGMRGDGPAPTPAPFRIERADAKLDALVAADAKLEELARGFGLNEGPVWVPEGDSGYLLVGGLLDNVLYKIAADNTVSVFMEQRRLHRQRYEQHGHANAQRPFARAVDRPELCEPGLAGPADLVRRQRPHRDAAREGRHAHGAVGRRPRR